MERRWPWKKKSSDKVVNEKSGGFVDSEDASNQVCISFLYQKNIL